MNNQAFLLLENGALFCGESFGADNDAVGEAVFTTGMTTATAVDALYSAGAREVAVACLCAG